MPTFIAYKNGEKIGELVGADQAGLQVSSRRSSSRISADLYFFYIEIDYRKYRQVGANLGILIQRPIV